MPTPIDEYEAILERVFSAYLDATEGFRYMAQSAKLFVSPQAPETRSRDSRGVSPPGHVIYALGSPDDGNYMELSSRRGQQIIADNQDDGPNWSFMGSMCIVAAYQFWEDHYRARIASHLGIIAEQLKIPIFGDLRRLRNAIVHNGSRWTEELRRVECFPWKDVTLTEPSEEILFPRSLITSIWWLMRLALEALKKQKPEVNKSLDPIAGTASKAVSPDF